MTVFEFFPGRDVLQPDEVAVAHKLYGRVGVRDVRLVLVPLLDPEVVVLVLVSVHRHLHTELQGELREINGKQPVPSS